ncbi:MAG: chemotaxis protein CheC [Clostridiales bacterium]|nr:chemotaxis protein CheC [Clostridiales bacterium]
MSNFSMDAMDNMQFDVLREIGNIGAGNAMTALSQLLNKKIDMGVPKVELIELKNLPDAVGGADAIVVGILLTLSNDVEGMIMFIVSQETARKTADVLLGQPIDPDAPLTEMEISALQEIGNIITGAYMSALSMLTHLNVNLSIPYMAVDMAGAVLSVPAIEFGKVGDQALLIQSEFGGEDDGMEGYFILIPTEESSGKILSSLGL